MSHVCHQEQRIANLERSEGIMKTKIDNLIDKLDTLTGWIKALVITTIPCVLTAIGFLLVYWIKN